MCVTMKLGRTLEALADGGARHINEVALLEHVADLQLLPGLIALYTRDLQQRKQ